MTPPQTGSGAAPHAGIMTLGVFCPQAHISILLTGRGGSGLEATTGPPPHPSRIQGPGSLDRRKGGECSKRCQGWLMLCSTTCGLGRGGGGGIWGPGKPQRTDAHTHVNAAPMQ